MRYIFKPDFTLTNLNLTLTSGAATSAVLPASSYYFVTVYSGSGNVNFVTNNLTSAASFSNSLAWPNGTRDILNTTNTNIHLSASGACNINIVGGTIR